jgi:hypothetical protein
MIKLDKNDLNVFIKKTKGASVVEYDNKLKMALSSLKDEARNYMSDTTYYRKINEEFRNDNHQIYAKAISLAIEQHPEVTNKHILKVTLLHPSMRVQGSTAIASGSKEDILKFLNDNKTEETLKNTINSISKTLEDK